MAERARLDELLPPALAVRSARALAASPLGGRWARLGDVLRPQPLVERHLDWVTAGRRHLRGALYGPLLDGRRVDGELLDGLIPPTPPEHVPGELMRLDQRHWLPHDVLVKADRAGMLVSLEVRTPYLHRPLAEFAATVAARTHVAHDGKVLLRGVAAKLMPGTPRRRPKTAFRVPAADWLRGPLEPALAAQLAGGALYEEGWFDREEVRRLAREHAARRADWTHALWPLLALGLWLDRFRGRDAR